ncbi:hypothetical protein SPRG_22352 [Saprolegnia parasitica CBS 223.65]|uniref:Uncharacterized protein n=1 Tax=Saprolegnia parasitica (strain CBS 223.65) TaxID=695850 RepID=A0A067BM20_SAPPC|nr:hypothetical protein SPRG_22352 [Saprolegnia parasitica CBS 223.65]KDO19539.1 hypothetical protein SPRG_22352 [Saprolegnia parasitica CBS 223.65]|eukprot:XP_012209766.1 hypothetical protein SPRG_22352 [Saprolegnia parasitica CBS 223.65]
MLATSATAVSCTADQDTEITNFLAAHVSTSCIASRPSWKSSMTFADGLDDDQYLMCRPPCKADLQSLTSSIPECVNDAGTFTKVAQLNQLCTDMTRPTTNGVMALCGSATCSAFINAMANLMPNCVDTYGDNTMDEFRHRYGCMPAAVGTNCSMVDMAVKHDAYNAYLWYNCSSFLNASYLAMFSDLEYSLSLIKTPEDAPSGFCTSACPANYLWMKKTLPSCTYIYGGEMLSDPSPLYRICPNLKPAPSSAPTRAPTRAPIRTPTRAPTPAPTPAPALTCPLRGSYRATGMRMDLATSGDFTESHDGSGSTCSTTGTYAVSGPMATFTVSTVTGVCSSVFTPYAKHSVPISFSTDCNQLTLSYTGTTSTLQRTSNAETAATSAMLLLGVFLAWGAL